MRFGAYALYKYTFYLLTYLLTSPENIKVKFQFGN